MIVEYERPKKVDQTDVGIIGRNKNFGNLFAKRGKVGYTLNVARDRLKENGL